MILSGWGQLRGNIRWERMVPLGGQPVIKKSRFDLFSGEWCGVGVILLFWYFVFGLA